MAEITEQEIIRRLNSDVPFAIEFAVMNQPQEIIANLQRLGFNANTDAEAMEILTTLWEGRDFLNFSSALNVPYNNTSGNWTEGFISLFPDPELLDTNPVGENPNQVLRTSGVWGAALSGLGAFATSLGGSLTGTNLTPEQIAAAKLAEEKRREEDRKRQTRTFLIVGLVVVVLAIVGVVWWSKNKGKK